MDTFLIAYILLVAVYRIAESTAMAKTGTLTRRPVRDWTAWLIILPYWFVIAGAPIEYMYADRQATLPFVIAGGVLFIAATGLRARAHLDLQAGFSMFLEKDPEQELVTTGLYSTIRHPLYLANVLLFIACPLFLGVAYTWIFTLLGIAGVLVRIEIEERFLSEKMFDYRDYCRRTWRLIPRVW